MIRKYLLAVSCCLVAGYFADAQINKGSLFLGGNINFATTSLPTVSNGNMNARDFIFSPELGWAIKNNVVAGFDLLYQYDKNSQNLAPDIQKQNAYGAGVFLRHYVPIAKNFYIFGQGRVGVSYINGKTVDQNNVENNNFKEVIAEFSFYPGVSYQVSRHLHLEAGFNNLFGISYNHTKSTDESIAGAPVVNNGNGFSAGLSLNNLAAFTVGFRVLLAK